MVLCGSQCLLSVPLCNFVSQRTTEQFHREPQRELGRLIRKFQWYAKKSS
jgi:hypothetical protein